MEIVISSVAFLGSSINEVVNLAEENQFSIEFSSGLPYDPQAIQKVQDASFRRYVHNYFPAPKEPFVLNLASGNNEIRNLSINHCIQGLTISKAINAPFFSAHAGFCIDPKPHQLGRSLNVDFDFDREYHWDLFKKSLTVVLAQAAELGVKFLIENNVLAHFNYNGEINPLFCCDGEEILRLRREVENENLSFLLDTAHWKVSSNTLNFKLNKDLLNVLENVLCIHHSDNDGALDTNEPLKPDYWFSDYMSAIEDICHVLEVKNLSASEVNNQITLLKEFSK